MPEILKMMVAGGAGGVVGYLAAHHVEKRRKVKPPRGILTLNPGEPPKRPPEPPLRFPEWPRDKNGNKTL